MILVSKLPSSCRWDVPQPASSPLWTFNFSSMIHPLVLPFLHLKLKPRWPEISSVLTLQHAGCTLSCRQVSKLPRVHTDKLSWLRCLLTYLFLLYLMINTPEYLINVVFGLFWSFIWHLLTGFQAIVQHNVLLFKDYQSAHLSRGHLKVFNFVLLREGSLKVKLCVPDLW